MSFFGEPRTLLERVELQRLAEQMEAAAQGIERETVCLGCGQPFKVKRGTAKGWCQPCATKRRQARRDAIRYGVRT